METMQAFFDEFIDEIHQIYVPFRTLSLIDMLKDAIELWQSSSLFIRSIMGPLF